jgi:competence protein ComEC
VSDSLPSAVAPGLHRLLAGLALHGERRRLVLWLPVLFGGGIAAHFALPVEPPLLLVVAVAVLSLLPIVLAPRGAALSLSVAAAAFALGTAAAGLRVVIVAAPVLDAPVTALVEGRLRGITASASGLPRLLLDEVTVYGLPPGQTPRRVRIALRRSADIADLRPGDWVSVVAALTPPGGPLAPGAFDFRMTAWFERLGAIGTARSGLARIAPARSPDAAEAAVFALGRVRADLAHGLVAAIGGEAGAVAAALAVGDVSGLSPPTLDALRDSNLAHLLSISGLHMAMVCGLVFAAVRVMLVIVPRAGLWLPVKRVAAAVAILAGLAYLALSGAAVPTQRAFVMAGVALAGVLVDRPAVSLRGLALAALVVLALAPESLFSAGFQMSFAATLALVAVYDETTRRGWLRPRSGWRAKAALYVAGLVLTSTVAGFATAPYAAWHFHRSAPYGLLANLLAVPVMGVVVAPALVLAAVLAPLGLEALALRAAEFGLGIILWIAHAVAALPGSVRPVPATGALPLGLVTLGGLWLCLWRGPIRGAALLPLGLAATLWGGAPRPLLLVAPEGALVAVRGPEGLVPDHPSAEGFAADAWLRRDGDGAAQAEAAARPGLMREGPWRRAEPAPGTILWLNRDRRVPLPEIRNRCVPGTMIVLPRSLGPSDPTGGCLLLDAAALADGRARALLPGAAGPTLWVAPAFGARPWQRPRAPDQ